MQETDYLKRLEESIELEIAAAHLYEAASALYSTIGRQLWQLAIEEHNHASLLESLRTTFFPADITAPQLLEQDPRLVRETCAALQGYTQRLLCPTPPKQDEFLRFAISFEQSASELHYQEYMAQSPESPQQRMLQRLNRDDRDHAKRLEALQNA